MGKSSAHAATGVSPVNCLEAQLSCDADVQAACGHQTPHQHDHCCSLMRVSGVKASSMRLPLLYAYTLPCLAAHNTHIHAQQAWCDS